MLVPKNIQNKKIPDQKHLSTIHVQEMDESSVDEAMDQEEPVDRHHRTTRVVLRLACPPRGGHQEFACEARLGDVLLKLKPSGVAELKFGTNKPVDFENWATLFRMNLESRHRQLVAWWDFGSRTRATCRSRRCTAPRRGRTWPGSRT